MSDRRPTPAGSADTRLFAERASATPTRAVGRNRTRTDDRGARRAAPGGGLRDVQEWMLDAVAGPEPDADATAQTITAGPRLTASERLDVYRADYRARLVECLLDDYPVLAKTVGHDVFETMCLDYMERYPSRSPNLNFFGRHMAELCLEHPKGSVFAGELAQLEWALVEVLHAGTPEALDLAGLQSIPVEAWAGVRFVPNDTVQLLRFTHPVNAYFQAIRDGHDETPRPSPAASATVVYRQELTLWRMDLTPAMALVLEALLAGKTIREALSQIEVDELERFSIARNDKSPRLAHTWTRGEARTSPRPPTGSFEPRSKSVTAALDADAQAEAARSVMIWFREWVQAGMFARAERAPT